MHRPMFEGGVIFHTIKKERSTTPSKEIGKLFQKNQFTDQEIFENLAFAIF